MTKKVIYLDDVLDAIESCEHYPLFDTKKMSIGIVDFVGLVIKYLDIKEAIEQLPSAEPEPKTGEWREHIFDGFMGGRPRALRCTRCNYISLSAYNFCPWCGADMRGEEDE